MGSSILFKTAPKQSNPNFYNLVPKRKKNFEIEDLYTNNTISTAIRIEDD